MADETIKQARLETQTATPGAPAVERREFMGWGAGQRSAYATRDLTTGSIPRNLWFLAWPQTVSGSLMVVDSLVDFVWAGFFGARAIAGIGVAQTWTMLTFMVRMGIDTSMRAMISRAVGAGDLRLANHATVQAFTLSGAFSLIVSLVGILLAEALLRLLGVSEAVVAQGVDYLRMQFVAMLAMALMMMGGSALQAAGDPITPMKAQIASRVVHLVLSPTLIFGLLWFPRMGIAGAALANVLGGLVAAAWNFSVLFRGGSRLHLTFRGYHVDFPLLWRMICIGAPASVTSMEMALSQMIIVFLVARFGDTTLAAYALTQRVQMVTNLGSMGFGMGAGVLVGQSLGAGKPERAKQAVGWALLFVLLLSLAMGSLLLVLSRQFLTIFTRETALLEVAIPWLRILVAGFMILGTGMIFMQSFSTAGDTFVPMLITLMTVWGVQMPLAIMLSGAMPEWHIFGLTIALPTIGTLGQFGIPWAIVMAMAARLVLYVPYFFTGRWMRQRLFVEQPMLAGSRGNGD